MGERQSKEKKKGAENVKRGENKRETRKGGAGESKTALDRFASAERERERERERDRGNKHSSMHTSHIKKPSLPNVRAAGYQACLCFFQSRARLHLTV